MIHLVSASEQGMLEDAGDRPPLGVLYLSAALRAHNYMHEVHDLNHVSEENVLHKIGRNNPLVVGLSTMSPSAERMKDFARKVRDVNPTVPIIAGGFHVTNKPGDFWDVANLEVYGYGESKLINLISDMEPGEEFEIDRYPIPNRDALDETRYGYKLEGMKATTMITSRGCPHSCVFCSNFDKKQKRRTTESVEKELEDLSLRGYKAVYLLDDTFTLMKGHAKRVAEHMKDHGLKYRIEARANTITDDLAKLLGETGCVVAGMGIESGDDQILKYAGKRQNTEQVRNAVTMLGENGIKTKGFFIIGLPGETYETARRTIEFADELREGGLAYADFYPLCPYPGSPVARDPEKFGIEIVDADYSHYLNGGKELLVPTQTRDLNAGQIKNIIQEARDRWK